MIALLAIAHAATLSTCGSEGSPEPECFAGLGEALQVAGEGDTILLGPGVYTESVTLEERRLRLEALEGPGSVLWLGNDQTIFTVSGGEVELLGLNFIGRQARFLELDEAAVVRVEDALLQGGQVQGDGGLIRAEGESHLELVSSTFLGGSSTGHGGQVFIEDGSLLIEGCVFQDGLARHRGGAVYGITTGLRLDVLAEDSRFVGGEAVRGSGGLQIWGEKMGLNNVVVRRCTFEGNSGAQAAAFSALTNSSIYEDNYLVGNTSSAASAIVAKGYRVEIRRNTICSNVSGIGSSSPAVWIDWANTLRFTNNRLVDNRNGALALEQVADGEIRNNLFLGNTGAAYPAFVIDDVAWRSIGVVQDNIFAYNRVTGTGLSPVRGTDTMPLVNNLFWGNQPEVAEKDVQGGIYADPRLLDYALDQGCPLLDELSPWDPLWMAWDSAARDAGVAEDLDLDGSPPDIGVFGGPDARAFPDWEDPDGDGSPNLYDCAPYDGSIHPDAEDAPYDGLDTNCDGWDDDDADQDGQVAATHGGLDCDDTDPTIWFGAPEVPYDGIDQSCDGSDLVDADEDGYNVDVDCDDRDPGTHPGLLDLDPEVDRNCDGFVDLSTPLTRRSCGLGPPSLPLAFVLLPLLALWRRRC